MSYTTPNPPRRLVLPFPVTSQANPTRGAQFFLSGKFTPVGAPGSPGYTNPVGALGNSCDCNPGMTEKERPCVSSFGLLYSYRMPRLRVSLFASRQSSCRNP